MFGLSVIQERLAFVGVLAVVVFGFAWHERSIGAQKCLQNVEKANVVEEKKQEKQHTIDEITVKSEGKTFEDTIKAPIAPAPVVRLCPSLHREAVPAAPTAGAEPDAGPQVEQEIRSNLPSGTLLQLSKQGEMQTRRSEGFRITLTRYAGLPRRPARDLFPQAVSPPKSCPRQYDYYVWDRFLLCWGEY